MEKKIKIKYDWCSSPDKIEKWLEDMEEQGYNLYKINKFIGIFTILLQFILFVSCSTRFLKIVLYYLRLKNLNK